MKKFMFYFLPFLFLGIIVSSCSKDSPSDKIIPLDAQVRVQSAFDNNEIAFRFQWKSQSKSRPAGFDNVGKQYPGQFHDLLKHNGTKFDRLPSGQRMEEDRVTFMIDRFDTGAPGFATANCAITCHSGMSSHHLLTDHVVDHWHWRGGRSGPMGYAEDAAVNNVERIRDNLGTPPSKFLRAAGDRLREDQAAMTGSAHAVLSDGFPRFVLNKGKKMPGDYTIPGYFITNADKITVRNPYAELPMLRNLNLNTSLLVVYQDRNFDKTDKVNALDLAYLVWVATSETSHLPNHLRDATTADFAAWRDFSATESGIAPTAASAALTKLNEVHQEWTNSQKNSMVARSVGFIYQSDQHDITSDRSYDPVLNEWTVILYRKLSTGSNRDVDLSGLTSGAKYSIGFAMHDIGGAAESHNISIPYVLASEPGFDIESPKVGSVRDVNWNDIPSLDTYYVKPESLTKYNYDWLKSAEHPGASSLGSVSCVTCHTGTASLLTNAVLK